MNKIIKLLFPIPDYIFILQQEEYANKRLLHWLKKYYLRRTTSACSRIDLTYRAILILCINAIFIALIISFIQQSINPNIFIIIKSTILLTAIFSPITLILSNIISEILVFPIQKYKFYLAQEKINKFRNVITDFKVIAITGSTGKTTLKNEIYELLKYHHRVCMIPGNINTLNGIVNYILNLSEYPTIIILELDTYFNGEILPSINLLKPDIRILTNVIDQHNIRFYTEQDKIEAYLEIFSDSENNINLAKEDIPGVEHIQNIKLIPKDKFREDTLNIISKHFEIPNRFLDSLLLNPIKPERRGEITTLYGFECIDESYNISLNSSKFVINRILSTKPQKKLIIVTGGLPELRKNEIESYHAEFAKVISVADIVILSNSDYKTIIEKNLIRIGKSEIRKIQKYVDLAYVLNDLEKDKYLLVLFPELNELYY